MIHGMTVIEEIMLQRKNRMEGVKFAREYQIRAKLRLFSDTFKQNSTALLCCAPGAHTKNV